MNSGTAGSITYNVTINTSGLSGQINGVNNTLGNAGATGAAGFSAKFGAIAGITSSIFSKVTDSVTSSIGDAVKRVDTLNNAPKVLANLGFDASASAASVKLLAAHIQGLPTRLDDIVQQQVAIAASTGYSIGKVTDLTVAFNDMALAGGKGPEEAQRAFTQFTQALGRGKFQAQDFNTLMEVMPAQLSQVAKSLLGPTANAQTLRNALSDGTVTNDQFVNSVIGLDKKAGPGFSSFSNQAIDATKGVGTGMENLHTAIVRGLANIIQSIGSANISNAIAGITNVINIAFKVIADVIKFIADHKDIFGPIAIAIGVLAAAIVTLSTVMGIAHIVQDAWKDAQMVWQGVTKVATAVQWLFNAAISANPIGLIIIAIAAFIAAIILLWNNSDAFRNFFIGAWDAIKNAVVVAFNWVKDNWPLLLAILTGPIGIAVLMIVKHWDTIKSAFSEAWNFIKGIWSGVGSWFSNNVINPIINLFSGIGGRIAGFFSGIWSGIGSSLKSIINSVLHLPLKIPSISVGGVHVGGQTLIPALASGGIVQSPTTALIGEAGREAVLPLDHNTGWMDELAKKMGGGGPTTIIVKVGEETLLTKVIDGINNKSALQGYNAIKV